MLKHKIANLLSVKSILTLAFSFTLCFIIVHNILNGIASERMETLFAACVTSAFTFYFSRVKDDDNKQQ